MDEEEELYRQMNPEDDFYMGDPEEEPEDSDEITSPSQDQNNSGCAGVFFFLFLLVFGTFYLIL